MKARLLRNLCIIFITVIFHGVLSIVYKFIIGITLTFLPLYAHSQNQEIGLFCPVQDEPPRIFYVNLTNPKSSHFDLSRGVWKDCFLSPIVEINQLTINPEFAQNYERKLRGVVVDRTTLKATTRLTADYNYDASTVTEFSCSVHTAAEIREIATREYERLSSVRAF